MFAEILPQLDVEMDQTVHCYSHTGALNNHDLEDQMSVLQSHVIDQLLTHMCANAGFRDSKQYLPPICVTSATRVVATRIKQY